MKWSKQSATTKEQVSCCAVAMVVSGLAFALTVPSIVRALTSRHCGKIKADVWAIEQACEEFLGAHGRYPTVSEELARPDAEGRYFLKSRRLPIDPWGRPYSYDPPARQGSMPRIFTLGRDGEPGGEGLDADVFNFDLAEQAGIGTNRSSAD